MTTMSKRSSGCTGSTGSWFLGKWQNSTTNEEFEVLNECKGVLFVNPLSEQQPFSVPTSEWVYSNHREGTDLWESI